MTRLAFVALILLHAPFLAAEKAYLWFEAETTLKGDTWNTSNFYAPSGGLFLYQCGAAPPATAEITVPLDDWAVWIRARDETQGVRQLTATLNGVPSYTMGGTDAGQWMWYAAGVAHDTTLSLVVTPTSPTPWDAWVDVLLVTNDLAFVPPGAAASPEGFPGYKPELDQDLGRRAAWIWYPHQPEPGSTSFYRKTFDMPEAPGSATLAIQAFGRYVVYLNDIEVDSEVEIGKPGEYEVAKHLRPGANTLDIQLTHDGFLPALNIRLDADTQGGNAPRTVSDLTWQATSDGSAVWNPGTATETAWHRVFARVGEREQVGH